MAPRITVVNDNPDFLELLRDILEDERYATTTIDGDRDDALERIIASGPDLLIIDLRLGDDELHGWDIAQDVRRTPSLEGLPVIVCSGDMPALESVAEDLEETTEVLTLAKPFGIEQLTDAISSLLGSAAR